MTTKKVYVEATKYKNLAGECLVLLRSFYCGIQCELVNDYENADISIRFLDNTLEFRGLEQLMSFTEIDESKDLRLFVKQVIYDTLSKYLNRRLPWGILQGIRPTKLVFKLLYKYGYDIKKQNEDAYVGNLLEVIPENVQECVVEELVDRYRLTLEMAKLCLEVVRNEAGYVNQILNQKNNVSIYIGVPFCPSRCLYCSFTSNEASKWQHRMDEYIDNLILEWDNCFENKALRPLITSLYIGGGTPTTLSARQFDKLLSHINRYVSLKELQEFTIEAGRPNTITKEKLEVFKNYHVTRLSINPQTMSQKTLDVIGRNHSVEDIHKAYRLAKEVGSWRINMDMIVGLPGEGEIEVKETLDALIKLRPDELTVHTMAIKRSSRLHEQLERYPLPSYQTIDDILKYIRGELNKNNYQPYYLYRQKNIAGGHENVGYYCGEKPGIYNISIMEEIETILGFGAGTVTKIVSDGKVKRLENPKNVEIYMERVRELGIRKRDNL